MGLAPWALWRLPSDVQLPARLAFGAVRPPLLPQLVGMRRGEGGSSRPLLESLQTVKQNPA